MPIRYPLCLPTLGPPGALLLTLSSPFFMFFIKADSWSKQICIRICNTKKNDVCPSVRPSEAISVTAEPIGFYSLGNIPTGSVLVFKNYLKLLVAALVVLR